MKKSYFKSYVVAGILIGLFILLTIAIQRVDVRPVGPEGSSVGFSTVNQWASQRLGVHFRLYTITDWLSIAALLTALGFAALGVIQWIKRKNLLRVDRELLVLGGFYLIVFFAYGFFEFHVINYRPVLIEGRLEASYPSSTTVLMLCVMPTAMMQVHRLIQNGRIRRAVNAVIAVFTVSIVALRLLSGVHWMTDILGGALLSAGLVMLYVAVVQSLVPGQRQ